MCKTVCNKMFSGEVVYDGLDRVGGNAEEFAPLEEADSFEEWRDTYISLLMDVVDSNPDAERVAEKLQNGDYEVELDCDGETEYTYVTVHLMQ